MSYPDKPPHDERVHRAERALERYYRRAGEPRSVRLQRPATYEPGDYVELHPEPTHEGPHPDDADTPRRFALVVRPHVHPGNPEWTTGYTVIEDGETATVKPGAIKGAASTRYMRRDLAEQREALRELEDER
jgi:hypothetical protein